MSSLRFDHFELDDQVLGGAADQVIVDGVGVAAVQPDQLDGGVLLVEPAEHEVGAGASWMSAHTPCLVKERKLR